MTQREEEIEIAYKSGELTFDEACTALEELYPQLSTTMIVAMWDDDMDVADANANRKHN